MYIWTEGVREVNARVQGKGLDLLNVNTSRFEIKQLLFVHDTALVAESEKLCRLVGEFGIACARKLRVKIGKSKLSCPRSM